MVNAFPVQNMGKVSMRGNKGTHAPRIPRAAKATMMSPGTVGASPTAGFKKGGMVKKAAKKGKK